MFRRKKQQGETKVAGTGGSNRFGPKVSSRRTKGSFIAVENSEPSFDAEDPSGIQKKYSSQDKSSWFGHSTYKSSVTLDKKKSKKMRSMSMNDDSSSVYSRDDFFAKLDELETKSLHTSANKRKERVLSDAEAARLDLCQLIVRKEWKRGIMRIRQKPGEARKTKKMSLRGLGVTTGLPLHLAVTKRPPADFVEALIRVYPDGPKQPDKQWKRLPIHIACICDSGGQVLQVLMDAHKMSLRVVDQAERRVPLHYVCRYGSPYEISVVMNAARQALRVKDAHGKTPVDLARENPNQHRETIVRRLESTLRAMDSPGGMTLNSTSSRSRSKRGQQHQQHPPPPQSQERVSSGNHSSNSRAQRSGHGSKRRSDSSGQHDFNDSISFDELHHPSFRMRGTTSRSSTPKTSSLSSSSSSMNASNDSMSVVLHSTEDSLDINDCEHNRSITFQDEMLARSLQESIKTAAAEAKQRGDSSMHISDSRISYHSQDFNASMKKKERKHRASKSKKDKDSDLMRSFHERAKEKKKKILGSHNASPSSPMHFEKTSSGEISVSTPTTSNRSLMNSKTSITREAQTTPALPLAKEQQNAEDVNLMYAPVVPERSNPIQVANVMETSITNAALTQVQNSLTADDFHGGDLTSYQREDTNGAESINASHIAIEKQERPPLADRGAGTEASSKVPAARRSSHLNNLEEDDEMQPRSRKTIPQELKGNLDSQNSKGETANSAPRASRNSYDYDAPSSSNQNWEGIGTGGADSVSAASISTSARTRNMSNLLRDLPRSSSHRTGIPSGSDHPLNDSESLLGSFRMPSDTSSITPNQFFDNPHMNVDALIKTAEEQEQALSEKDSEISQLETHLKNLDLRKEALDQESRYVRKSMDQKTETASKHRKNISKMQKQLDEIQMSIAMESEKAEAAESGIKVLKETLKEHEERVSGTHTEKEVLLTIRENLIQERKEMTRKLINTRNEIKSLREIQTMAALA